MTVNQQAIAAAVSGVKSVELTEVEAYQAWRQLEQRGLTKAAIAQTLGVSVDEVTDWRASNSRPKARAGGAAVDAPRAVVVDRVQGDTEREIAQAKASTSTKVQRLADRAEKAIADLREGVENDKHRAAAEAEVKRLEAQLAAAKARLRGAPVPVASPVGKTSNNEPSRRKVVTEWAVEEGLIEVGRRGQLPMSIYDAYDRAHS